VGEIYFSSGSLFLWEKNWWDYLDEILLNPAVSGIQILFTPFSDYILLPAQEIIGYIRKHLNIVFHPIFFTEEIAFSHMDEKKIVRLKEIMYKNDIKDIIFHSNHIFRSDQLYISKIRKIFSDFDIIIENMGNNTPYGRSINEIKELLNEYEQLKVVLDIAHLQELNDGVLNWLNDPLISDKIKYIHLSLSTTVKQSFSKKLSKEFNTISHVPAFLNHGYPSSKVKKMLSKYPLIMEGCFAFDTKKETRWLFNETDYLSKWN
jgi:hypothetical protein|tara:strand:- start:8 stop:793 length:786 start_codon:yes stop_codon:yes gene_type:complete